MTCPRCAGCVLALVCVNCGWESALDASPRWAELAPLQEFRREMLALKVARAWERGLQYDDAHR